MIKNEKRRILTLTLKFIGAGGYSDDNIGTVSTTGYGESILKYNLAHRILSLMEGGMKH